MRRRSLVIFFLLLVTALSGANTTAQERFGTLTGRVTDQQGQAVPGVTVTTTNTQSGEVRTFVTDSNGVYSARDLNPGRYTVAFELSPSSPTIRRPALERLPPRKRSTARWHARCPRRRACPVPNRSTSARPTRF